MFKPPSQQRDYTLCSQEDEALDLPVVPELQADATDEDRARVAAAVAERDQKIKVARERGGNEWALLTKPGKMPTRFNFRQVPRHSINWWGSESEYSSDNRRPLSHAEVLELLFRLALDSVDNLGSYKAEFVDHGPHRLLTIKSLNELYSSVGARVILQELASIVATRIGGMSPLG